MKPMVIRDDRLSKHFRAREFRCKCRRPECDAVPMDKAFVAKLQALRDDWGLPLSPTSGVRCRFWNERIRGYAPNSMHLKGRAADFWFEDPNITAAFIALAEKHGFGGIGKGRHKVHLDDREHPARWVYKG